MHTDEFVALVQAAVDDLPEEFAERLWNLQLAVEMEPSREQLEEMDLGPGDTLLGLYQGVPLPERGSSLSGDLPDIITIFQGPIERECGGDPACIRGQVERTVRHEVAHYFGISDERLEELDRY